MADFVAVIRRAVDGLSNNTPEMRAKVYDKARGAVQRQLENMKPRPPEDMLLRQMEKLEAAILDVESEHAEALPPEDENAAVAAPVIDAPVEEQAAEPEQVAAAPEADEPAPVQAAAEEQQAARFDYVEPETVEPAAEAPQAPVFREDDYQEPAHAAEAVAEEHPEAYEAAPAEEQPVSRDEPQVEPEAPVAEEVAAAPQQYGDWRDDVPAEESIEEPVAEYRQPEPETQNVEPAVHAAENDEQPVEPAQSFEPQAAEQVPVEDDFPYPTRGEQTAEPAPAAAPGGWFDLPTPGGVQQPVETAKPVEDLPQAVAVDAAHAQGSQVEAKQVEDWGWDTPAQAPSQQVHAAAVWDDVPELVPAGPVEPIHHGAAAEGVDAHFDTQTHVTADAVRMPSVAELPDLPPTTAAATAAVVAADPFADLLDQHTVKPVEKKQPAEAAPVAVAATDKKAPAEDNPWGDLEELIGFNKDGQTSAPRGALHTDADADDLMHAPAKPYRVTPVRKRNYAGIILAIVGLAVLGGGGYAAWLNRDSLNDMVDGLIESSLSSGSSQSAQQTPATANPRPSTPAASGTTPSTPTTPANPATPPRANGASNTPAATPRPADGSTANTKFTQRLMADGTETDAGPGTAGNLAQNAEGQSVAQLNSPPGRPAGQPAAPAPGTPAPAAPAPTTPAPATPAPGAANTPAPSATPATTPAVAGEKMFLYEERIGQTAPTAIDGSVSWSLQREQAANGKQEPVIQGRITIPGRGLTALVTLKRNSDPSLPASHLIEIVFAVPPDFEGGAIDSVQRIAMKSTEQDRGNALIAVPAKITDDFHMIALNDFPDARSTNLDLLRTRNWMDIPVAYRNGRRALLTLQKGAEGERVFNEAIREWATLGPTSGQ